MAKNRKARRRPASGLVDITPVKPVVANSCGQVKLSVFIRCLFHDEYDGLILAGAPSTEAIAIAWKAIVNEYAILNANDNTLGQYMITGRAASLENKIKLVDAILRLLGIVYSEEAVRILQDEGVEFEFNPDNPEQYKADMVATRTELDNWVLELQQYIDMLPGEEEGGQKLTELYFEELLSYLSTAYKMMINADEITVLRFCTLLKRATKS